MYTKSLAWQDRYIAANRWRPTGTNSQHSSARLGADSSDSLSVYRALMENDNEL